MRMFEIFMSPQLLSHGGRQPCTRLIAALHPLKLLG